MSSAEYENRWSPNAALPPGALVEVRNRFVGSWSAGFTVDHCEADGYVVRRTSDGQSLPATFSPEEVRPTA